MIQRGRRCREARTRSSATRQHLGEKSMPGRRPFFSWRRMGSTVLRSEMESAMRMIGAASLVAVMMLAGAPARADWVPPFRGNDTGGIIAYALGAQTDVRQLAVDHCARYGKVVKFLAVDPHYGGSLSFALPLVPFGSQSQPLVAQKLVPPPSH